MRRLPRSCGRVLRALATATVAGAALLSSTAAGSAAGPAAVPPSSLTPPAAAVATPGLPGAALPLPSPGSLLPPTPTALPLPPPPTLCPGCLAGTTVPPVSKGVGGGGSAVNGGASGVATVLPGDTSTGRAGGRGAGTATATAAGAVGSAGERGIAAAGLHVVPPPVQSLGVAPGISFGAAPYLWPVFLVLDVLAAVLAAVVIRRTWSSPGD